MTIGAKQAYEHWRRACRSRPCSYNDTITTIDGRLIGMRRVGRFTNYVTPVAGETAPESISVAIGFDALEMAAYWRRNAFSRRSWLRTARREIEWAAQFPAAPLPGEA